MSLNTKQKNWLTVGSFFAVIGLIIIVLMIICLHIRGEKHAAYQNLHHLETISRKDKQDFNDKYNQLLNNYSKNMTNSHDPKINSIALNNQNYNNAYDRLDKFFNTYFTYDNEKQFDQRKNKLLKNNLITHSFAATNNFVAPKDKTGGSYIDGKGLSSEYIQTSVYSDQFATKSNDITVYAKVAFQSKFRDSWMNYTTNVYKVDYNQKNGTVNNLTKITTTNSRAVATNNDD